MGLFNKLKDNFKSSDFSVAGNSKVKTLKKNCTKKDLFPILDDCCRHRKSNIVDVFQTNIL